LRITKKVFPFIAVLVVGCSSIGISTEPQHAAGVTYYLPKTLVNVEVHRVDDLVEKRTWFELGDANGKLSAEYVPDIQHQYVLKYHPSVMTDDRLCISRSPDGLLYDVQFASDDRTPEVIFNVTRFVAGLIGPGGSPTAGTSTVAEANKFEVRKYVSQIDPFDRESIATFNIGMRSVFGSDVWIDLSRMYEMLGAYKARRLDPEPRCEPPFVCYRTMVRVPIYLVKGKTPIAVVYAEVANKWDVGHIDVTRAALVHKITKLRFERGVLTAAMIRKPSEAEELSLIPVNVGNAILSVPAGFFSRAFGSRAERDALVTEVQNLNEKTAALKATQDLIMQGSGPTIAPAQNTFALNCQAGARATNGFTTVDITPVN
jgi:hypothetical protein